MEKFEEKFFINHLENKILFPFYFNHVSFSKNAAENEEKFHNFIQNRMNRAIANLSNLMGNNCLFENLGTNEQPLFFEDHSAMANKNINITQKLNEVNQFRSHFHPKSPFFKHFKNLDVYASFFGNKNTIEGAVSLNVQYSKLSFATAAEHVYLMNMLNFFIRKQIMPLSFDNIVSMLKQEMGVNFLNEIKKSYVDRFNLIDFHRLSFFDLQRSWENFVDEKIDIEIETNKEYIKKDLFRVFFGAILIILFLLRSVNQSLNHVVKTIQTLTSTNKKITLSAANDQKQQTVTEIVDQLLKIFLDEANSVHSRKSFLENYMHAISSEKTRYVTLVENQYLKGHMFISDIYFFINCDYENWDNSFFRNKIFNQSNIIENVENNKILVFSDVIIHPEKYAIDFNTKNFAYYSDFVEMIESDINQCSCEICWDEHILENNVNNFILCRRNVFLNNQYDHFLNKYNKQFFDGLVNNYLWGVIILIARNNIKIYIEQYANFVTNMQFRNKSLEYRVILKDLQKIEFSQLGYTHGVKAINDTVQFVDKEFNFSESLKKLIWKVRTEDEIGKLIAERNSIATTFIVAEFVSLMWFVDTTFAIYQSTGSGNSPVPWIISEPLFHGFAGFTAFVLFVITCTLLFTIIRLYQRYLKEKKKGIRNFW